MPSRRAGQRQVLLLATQQTSLRVASEGHAVSPRPSLCTLSGSGETGLPGARSSRNHSPRLLPTSMASGPSEGSSASQGPLVAVLLPSCPCLCLPLPVSVCLSGSLSSWTRTHSSFTHFYSHGSQASLPRQVHPSSWVPSVPGVPQVPPQPFPSVQPCLPVSPNAPPAPEDPG